VNSIGFAITIISIQLISGLRAVTDTNTIYICLAIGPILGLLALSIKQTNYYEIKGIINTN
jgi:hypothetical protein